VTVNLVPPGAMYGDRLVQVDLRFAKRLRFGAPEATFAVDLYNVLNANPVLSVNAIRRVAAAADRVARTIRTARRAVRFLSRRLRFRTRRVRRSAALRPNPPFRAVAAGAAAQLGSGARLVLE